MIGLVCPPSLPTGPSTPPPTAPHVRYADPRLQEVYARLYAAFREPSVPIYGKVISEDGADIMARQVVDAARVLPQSAELQTRARCIIEPQVRGAATAAVGHLLLGAFTAVLAGVVGLGAWRTLR